MASPSFSIDNGPIEVETTFTNLKGSNWLRGSGTWFPLEIPKPFGVETITQAIKLECIWKPRENWVEAGTAGIFLPVEDVSTDADDYLVNGYSLAKYSGGNTGRIELTEWEFGEKANLIINNFNWENNDPLPILLRCNPCFRDEKDTATLLVKMTVMKDNIWQKDNFHEGLVRFKPGGTAEIKRFEFEYLEKLGALSIEGNGNSIHPKQLVSIIGLEDQLKKFKPNECRIAYIGADTTENLRSLCRFLTQNKDAESKISSFTVYYTKDWDEKLIKSLRQKFPLDNIEINGKKLIQKRLPEPPEIPNDLEKADVIIATYVTPWVLEMIEDEPKNKIQYKKLLSEIMIDESVIISTDPISSDHSVRSILLRRIDNNDFYQLMMDLLPHDTEYYERKSCKRTYWKKGVK